MTTVMTVWRMTTGRAGLTTTGRVNTTSWPRSWSTTLTSPCSGGSPTCGGNNRAANLQSYLLGLLTILSEDSQCPEKASTRAIPLLKVVVGAFNKDNALSRALLLALLNFAKVS